MNGTDRMKTPPGFSEALYQGMLPINPGVGKLAQYEFRYALENLYPAGDWDSIQLDVPDAIERRIASRDFYESVQLKPRVKERIVLDQSIARLTRMLMVGLVNGRYSAAWVKQFFYFDIRGFYFLPRTQYMTAAGKAHLGGRPFQSFKQGQVRFDEFQDIGYLEFQDANNEIDGAFVHMLQDLIMIRENPVLITLAGPTAAGKTEITERLMEAFEHMGKKTTTIEMDNFLMDRDSRDGMPIGKATIHFELFKESLQEILRGRKITIPCYDSIEATSSHDRDGSLRPGRRMLQVEPGDIVFLEGNFPFQIPEIRELIHLLVVYLTDDPIRLKRKWKRDVDYRKNYDPAHFRNRYFVTQFLRAEDCYRPLIEHCDILVDTTRAEVWLTPATAELVGRQ